MMSTPSESLADYFFYQTGCEQNQEHCATACMRHVQKGSKLRRICIDCYSEFIIYIVVVSGFEGINWRDFIKFQNLWLDVVTLCLYFIVLTFMCFKCICKTNMCNRISLNQIRKLLGIMFMTYMDGFVAHISTQIAIQV